MSKVSLINGHIDEVNTCEKCIHYEICSPYTAPNESYPEVNGCKCFKAKENLVEVRHGYWKQTQEPLGWRDVDCVECSVCGESWIMDEDLSLEEHTQGWNYCLNCGAKMDGERRGKE